MTTSTPNIDFGRDADLKAKVQLSTEADYLRLLELWGRNKLGTHIVSPVKGDLGFLPATLIKISTTQEYVLDGINAPLWNSGLTLAIRRMIDLYPSRTETPVSTISLKEAIFNNMVDLEGHLLKPDGTGQTPYYEIKESEEVVNVTSWNEMLEGVPLTRKTCNSRLLEAVQRKYPVPGGIRCVGSFVVLRHIFQRKDITIEVDRCKFPHGYGYFVRFPPDEHIIFDILGFMKESGIGYVINLTSKTALFFQGLQDQDSGQVFKRNLFNPLAPPHIVSPFGAQEVNLLPSSLTVHPDETKPFTIPIPSIVEPTPIIVSPRTKSLLPASVPTTATGKTTSVGSSDYLTVTLYERSISGSSTDNGDLESNSSYINDLSDSGQKSKRGRKSLLTKILSNNEQVELKVGEFHVDLKQVPKEEIPTVLKEYNRKKNSEASARYRKRKACEIQQLKDDLESARQEAQEWKQKYEALEKDYRRLQNN